MGAALSKTGLDRRTPLATVTLVVAANAPDVDVLGYARGEYFALAFRRGITHGLPAQFVLPLMVTALVLGWDRWVRRRRSPDAPRAVPGQILLLSYLGVLTHPLLDWMNVYGMRWGLPFAEGWSYGDALFIIDPWLWLALGGAVALSGAGGRATWLLLGAVTTSVMVLAPVPPLAVGIWALAVCAIVILAWRGWPRNRTGAERLARGALLSAAAYVLVMLAADFVGRRAVASGARAAGLDVADVMLSPTPANPFTAAVEVVTAEGYVAGEHRWLPRPALALRTGERVPLIDAPPELSAPDLEALLGAAAARPDVAHYLVWARYPYVVVRRSDRGWTVRYSDARYDDRAGAGGLGGVEVTIAGPAGAP